MFTNEHLDQLDKAIEAAVQSDSDEIKAKVINYLRQFSGMMTSDARLEAVAKVSRAFAVQPGRVEALMMLDEDQVRDFFTVSRKVRTERSNEEMASKGAPKYHLPPSGWINDYLEFTRGNEAPELFHLWVGMSVLSATFNRKVRIEREYYQTFPNLFVILVAPSGACRRSTATAIGVKLVRSLATIRVVSEKVTPEALVEALSTSGMRVAGTTLSHSSTALIHAPELSVFLGNQRYNEGLTALLVTLFDPHDVWDSSTIARSTTVLRNVYLVLLGAVAPDWLPKSIPPAVFMGGFSSRTIFVYQSHTPRVFAFPEKPDIRLRDQLVHGLERISSLEGYYQIEPRAAKWYQDEWYPVRAKRRNPDVRMNAYYERKHEHLLKISMCLAASQRNDLVVTADDMLAALSILNHTEHFMPEVYAFAEGSESGANADRILSVIQRNDGLISRSKLLKAVYHTMNAKDLDLAMRTLVDMDKVVEVEDKAKHYVLRKEEG